MAHVHVIPVGDLVEHTHEDCVCGPDYEYIDPETGTAYPGGVAVKHHSLDGREQTERERLGVAQTGRAPVRTGDAETPAAVASPAPRARWADLNHKATEEQMAKARADLDYALLAFNTRRMLRALDGYWKVYEERDGAEAWWTVYERYRAKVERTLSGLEQA